MSYKVVESNTVYKGKVLSVTSDKVTMPNGNIATRETVVRGNAAAIVPIDNDGKIVFVRQYRHATRKMELEIPAGMIEENEDPMVAACRELEEEIGFKCPNLVFINDVYMAIGICTEKVFFYIAENMEEGVANPDPDEFIEIEKYTLDEAIEMVFNGTIDDVKTMAGILAYSQYLKNK
ncbi:MAG: NUDIX hydrolase [Anaerotignaceae bacterium]